MCVCVPPQPANQPASLEQLEAADAALSLIGKHSIHVYCRSKRKSARAGQKREEEGIETAKKRNGILRGYVLKK